MVILGGKKMKMYKLSIQLKKLEKEKIKGRVNRRKEMLKS